ncbi:MAG: YHS domain-containing protein [Cellulosilyticaceae bacterium]
MSILMDIVMNILLLFMLLSLFNIVRYAFKVRKIIKMHKDNPNVKGFKIVNGEIQPIEVKAEDIVTPESEVKEEEIKIIKEVVKDPVCGNEVEKKEAYRILKNGEEFYFCSWECREKFLNE